MAYEDNDKVENTEGAEVASEEVKEEEAKQGEKPEVSEEGSGEETAAPASEE